MGLFDRFRKRSEDSDAAEATVPDGPDDEGAEPGADAPSRAEQLAELRERIRETVDPGLIEVDDAREELTLMVADDPDHWTEVTEDEVVEQFERSWTERLARQAEWADEGDYGRLAAAFAELESAGIITRMDFACCVRCGHDEITDERGADSRGYTFFHRQDAQGPSPDAPSALNLAFGSFTPGTLGDEAIGAEIVQALRGRGPDPDWDGSGEARITLTGLDWRKRLPVG